MRKIILLMVICAITISCNEKQSLLNSIWNKTISTEKLLQTSKNSTLLSTVVIKSSDVTEKWKNTVTFNNLENRKLIYMYYLDDYCYIDLSLIIDEDDQATWLMQNKDIIDYERTKPYVEQSHRIPHPEVIPMLYGLKDSDFKPVKVADLISAVGTDIKYPNYIQFDLTGPDAVPLNVTKYGSSLPDIFSEVTIEAIIKANMLGPSDKIGIAIVNLPRKFAYLKVFKTGAIYDYSNEPR
ncbi:hypothetical protein [Flavobacterium sp.]|uniref:hypothetical protein n=1 Tax=Flavobacterium sp. TaxID=239 RepID=UPI0039E5EC84